MQISKTVCEEGKMEYFSPFCCKIELSTNILESSPGTGIDPITGGDDFGEI